MRRNSKINDEALGKDIQSLVDLGVLKRVSAAEAVPTLADEGEAAIPTWALTQPTQEILWGGAPICYRADGASGCFWKGTDEIGTTLEAVVFDWRWEREDRWGFPAQVWLDLACVVDGSASVLSLKKSSASNVFEWLMSLQKQNVAVHAQKLSLAFSEWKRPQAAPLLEAQTFYQVEVDGGQWISQEEFERIERFRCSKRFEYVLLGEIEDHPYGY